MIFHIEPPMQQTRIEDTNRLRFMHTIWNIIRQILKLLRPSVLFAVLRRLAFLLGLLVLIALGMRLAGPYVISSAVVRGAIEQSITLWTGYRTVIRGETDLAYWPTSRVVLQNVSIYANESDEQVALVEIPRLTAYFDLFSMLRGIPDFSGFHVLKPKINFDPNKNGLLNWSKDSRLAQAIAFFDNPGADISDFPADLDLHIGAIEIENGILNVTSVRGMTFSLSNITASVSWPHLSKAVSINMNGALNLSAFNMNVIAANPLPLLAGKNEPLEVRLESNAVNLSFSGITNLMNSGFVSGQLSMNAPSLSDLFLYAGFSSEKTGALSDFKLVSDISGEGSTLRLSNLAFSVSSTKATGVMDIGMAPNSPPQISGTLAFDRFSVDKAVEAFGPSASGAIDTHFLQTIRLDLRLSAEEATYSGLSLKDLGAGIRIADGRASLDIGESAFLGGTLMGRLAIKDDAAAGTGGGQLELRAEKIDIGTLAKAIKLPGPYPDTIGTINLSAATDVPLPTTRISDYHGSLELIASEGTLKNFDEAAFRTLAAAKKFFQLKEAEVGDFRFDSFSLNTSFADGIGDIRKVQIVGPDSDIEINGVLPYPEFSLAMTGKLKKKSDNSSEPDLNVFIGGTLASAVISPVTVMINNK